MVTGWVYMSFQTQPIPRAPDVDNNTRESQAFAFSKKASICLNPTWFQGSYFAVARIHSWTPFYGFWIRSWARQIQWMHPNYPKCSWVWAIYIILSSILYCTYNKISYSKYTFTTQCRIKLAYQSYMKMDPWNLTFERRKSNFLKKYSSKMTQNNGLLSNFIPKIGTTSLSLTPYCVVKCFFKKTRFTLGRL